MSSQLRLANFWGKRRANTSNVWDHFGFKCNEEGVIIDRSKATCKYCFIEIKYAGGNTSNLSSHYTNNHGSKVDKSTVQPSISKAFGATKKYPKGSNHQVMLERKLVEFLVADLRPLSTLDSPSLRKLLAALDPKFNIPDRKTIGNTVLPKMYEETKREVKAQLNSCSAVAVTTDGWQSIATESYTTFTAHFIDKDWNLKNFGLQTRYTPVKHTAENLKDICMGALEEWKLSEKTIAGVMDNARNITKAWELTNRPVVNCFAHTLNLAVKKGLGVNGIGETLKRARKLVSHFHHSPLQIQALKLKQEALDIPVKKLKMDVETRWNSTYDMIASILNNEEAIAAVLKADKKYRHLTLTPEDLTTLEEAKEVLKPCKDLTVTLSSEKDVTVSLIVPSLIRLKNMYLMEKESDIELIKQMKEAMRKDLETRYSDSSTKLLLNVSSLLDPRLKKLNFLPDDEKSEAHDELKQRMKNCKIEEQPTIAVKQESAEALPTLPSLNGQPHSSTTEMSVPKVENVCPTSPPAKKRKTDFFHDFFGDLIITKVEKAPSMHDKIEKEIKQYLDSDCVDLD